MNSLLLFVGWGRCGKDEAGAFFHSHLGVKCVGSTSWAALPPMAEILNLPQQKAWETRHENRQRWKDECDRLRKDNPLLLINRAFWGCDQVQTLWSPKGRVVTGIRDKAEIDAAKQDCRFKHIVWIDRPGIPEDSTVTFGPEDATDYVRNDGDLRRFHRNLTRWAISVGLDGVTLSDYASSLLLDPTP